MACNLVSVVFFLLLLLHIMVGELSLFYHWVPLVMGDENALAVGPFNGYWLGASPFVGSSKYIGDQLFLESTRKRLSKKYLYFHFRCYDRYTGITFFNTWQIYQVQTGINSGAMPENHFYQPSEKSEVYRRSLWDVIHFGFLVAFNRDGKTYTVYLIPPTRFTLEDLYNHVVELDTNQDEIVIRLLYVKDVASKFRDKKRELVPLFAGNRNVSHRFVLANWKHVPDFPSRPINPFSVRKPIPQYWLQPPEVILVHRDSTGAFPIGPFVTTSANHNQYGITPSERQRTLPQGEQFPTYHPYYSQNPSDYSHNPTYLSHYPQNPTFSTYYSKSPFIHALSPPDPPQSEPSRQDSSGLAPGQAGENNDTRNSSSDKKLCPPDSHQ